MRIKANDTGKALITLRGQIMRAVFISDAITCNNKQMCTINTVFYYKTCTKLLIIYDFRLLLQNTRSKHDLLYTWLHKCLELYCL